MGSHLATPQKPCLPLCATVDEATAGYIGNIKAKLLLLQYYKEVFLPMFQQSPLFTTEEGVLQRHSINHFLVHFTSIVRQMSINTLLTYLVSLRLSLSPWQLSDDV